MHFGSFRVGTFRTHRLTLRLGLRPTVWLIVLCTLSATCSFSDDLKPNLLDETKIFFDPFLPFNFELPSTWISQPELSSLVFSGPKSSVNFYTTISLQAIPDTNQSWEQLLELMLSETPENSEFIQTWQQPLILAGQPALGFAYRLNLHEMPRCALGYLFIRSTYVFALIYQAPTDLFAQGLPAFENLIYTLTWVD